MFGKLFLKEWKEKIGLFIFPFIGIVIIALVFLAFADGKSDLGEYLFGGLMFVYLPLTALLIGASGFQSEFKNDAWAYLFSRPVQKWQIWLIKYLALLSILLIVMLVFLLFFLIVPQFRAATVIFEFVTHYILLSFSAFTISFCLSFLFEKTYIILLTSIFLALGLTYISYVFFDYLSTFYPFESGIGGFFFFVLAAFIAASILTFIKADFTQVKKKILVFSGFLCAFIVLSLGINTVWTLNSYFSYAGGIQKYEGGIYFETEKGIFRYLPEQDKLESIKKMILLELSPSIRGGKIAYVKYKNRKCLTSELWVMDADGSRQRLLLERKRERRSIDDDCIEYYHPISSIILSPDGNKIAFIEETFRAESKEKEFAVSWMNSDGTELKSRPLDSASFEYANLLAWPEFEDNLFIFLRSQNLGKIIKFSLENLTFQDLDKYNKELRWHNIKISPRGDLMAIYFYDEETKKNTLSILDLKTLERREVFASDSVESIRWSDKGDRLGFVSEEKLLWVYDLSESKAEKVVEFRYDYYYRRFYDFGSNGRKLAAINRIDNTHYLQVFGDYFSVEKSMKIPLSSEYYIFHIGTGFNNFIFLEVENTEVWMVDLNTEEWRKIYPR